MGDLFIQDKPGGVFQRTLTALGRIAISLFIPSAIFIVFVMASGWFLKAAFISSGFLKEKSSPI